MQHYHWKCYYVKTFCSDCSVLQECHCWFEACRHRCSVVSLEKSLETTSLQGKATACLVSPKHKGYSEQVHCWSKSRGDADPSFAYSRSMKRVEIISLMLIVNKLYKVLEEIAFLKEHVNYLLCESSEQICKLWIFPSALLWKKKKSSLNHDARIYWAFQHYM